VIGEEVNFQDIGERINIPALYLLIRPAIWQIDFVGSENNPNPVD
jgi:hypothetical protein